MVEQHLGHLLGPGGVEDAGAHPIGLRAFALGQGGDLAADDIVLADEEGPLDQADFLVGEQAHGGPLYREAGGARGMFRQDTDHLEGNDGPAPRRAGGVCVPGRGLGDDLQLVVEAEGIEGAHVLVGVHANPLLGDALQAHVQVLQDHQSARRAQGGHATFQQGLAVVGAQAGRGLQHGRAIGLLGPDAGRGRAGGGNLGEGPDLLALHHHVQVVRGETAALEPGLAPDLLQQGRKKAEVGRSLDGARPEAELLGHGVVMDGGMAAIRLVGQHLAGRAQGAAKDEGGVKAHVGGPPVPDNFRRISASGMPCRPDCPPSSDPIRLSPRTNIPLPEGERGLI